MWIKICANTNVEDTRLAAELGADAVGFIFAPSKRQVTAEQVAAITPHLPNVETYGVFTPTESQADADAIAHTVKIAGLRGVQLHGSYDAAFVHALREKTDARVMQVVHWNAGVPAQQQAAQILPLAEAMQRDGLVERVLVDVKVGAKSGGLGVVFDWADAKPTLAQLGLPLVIAGGLNPENVAEAIATLHPFGVDVASGVEASYGRKDPAKLRAFIERAKAAENTSSR